MDFTFYNLHRQVRYIYRHMPNGEALTDHALGVAREQRQQIVLRVRQQQAEYRRGNLAVLPAPRPTELRAWDVFNAVTATARTEPFRRQVALERLAGDLLALSPLHDREAAVAPSLPAAAEPTA